MTAGIPSLRQRASSVFPFLFLLLLGLWGLINITQSLLTEIGHDESYYWMYSRYPDWGYFDHPPMIALFIRAGHWIFEGELGTRMVTVLAQLATLALLWTMARIPQPDSKRNLWLFFGIAASVVMFQVYGFIATPDSPLLLFTALFLWAYARFLEKENTSNLLLLAFTMAGLMYSKYHGALVILFTFLSNLRILTHWRFWASSLTALLLFLPHLLWQYQHDFPSFQYHLISRSRPFNIKHLLNYFPNQFLTFNPIFLGAVFFVLLRFRARDVFERALYWIIAGFLLFFLASTYRGHVEPHWTIAASIPMILLVFRHATSHIGLRRYVYRFLFPSILLICFVRIALMIDFLPVNTRFHGGKAWAMHLSGLAGDTPVVFRNSYQKPSIYMYYTGKPATALNSIYYRKTQYDLWPFEESFYGKKVILTTNVNDPWSQRHLFPNGRKEYLHKMDHFFSVQKITVGFDLGDHHTMTVGDTLSLEGALYNPYPYPIRFDDPVFPVIFNSTYIKSGNDMTVTPFAVTPAIKALAPGERRSFLIRFEVPDVCAGRYKFGITLQAGIIQEAFNSALFPVDVDVKG